MTRQKTLSKLCPARVSHSHTTRGVHPCRRTNSSLWASRRVFCSNFFCQNSMFEPGVVANLHPG